MERIKIAVVEDEPVVAMDIVGNLEQMGYTVIGPYDNGKDLLINLNETNPDLVLLDIQIEGDFDGIETAERIKARLTIPIIFITASSDKLTRERAQYANPHAYIIKPFNYHNLYSAIELALFNFCKTTNVTNNDKVPSGIDGYAAKNAIFVRKLKSKRFIKLPLEDVLVLEAGGSYTKIITAHDSMVICDNLKSLLQRLQTNSFIRVHRSYAINLEQVESVGEEELTVGSVNVPVSASYRNELFEQLNLL